MFCTRCGAAVPDNLAFCTACGAAAAANQPAPQVYQPPAPPVYQAPPPPPAPQGTVYQGPPPVYQAPVTPYVAAPQAAMLPYAGFWKRFLAYLIDGLILGVVEAVIFVAVFLMIGGSALISGGENPQDFFAALTGVAFLLIFLGIVALFVIFWLYFAKLESSEAQATWGKRALGIFVTDANGQRMTFGRASGRFFAKIITNLIPFGIGWIMAGFTAKKQALHDMIAGTLVWRRG
jgi:uncharacterized RDD family membrane protein YckC